MLTKILDGLLDVPSVAPRAFPGDYPSRIRLISLRKGQPFEYYGKPVKGLLDNLRRNYFLRGGLPNWLQFQEFDQNGMLAKVEGGEFVQRATFYGLYMPWQYDMRNFLSVYGIIYYLLNREPVVIRDHKMYKPLAIQETKYGEKVPQILIDCAKGNVDKTWFPGTDVVDVTAAINDNADKQLNRGPKRKLPTKPITAAFYKKYVRKIVPPVAPIGAPEPHMWGRHIDPEAIPATWPTPPQAIPANNKTINFFRYDPMRLEQQEQPVEGAMPVAQQQINKQPQDIPWYIWNIDPLDNAAQAFDRAMAQRNQRIHEQQVQANTLGQQLDDNF